MLDFTPKHHLLNLHTTILQVCQQIFLGDRALLEIKPVPDARPLDLFWLDTLLGQAIDVALPCLCRSLAGALGDLGFEFAVEAELVPQTKPNIGLAAKSFFDVVALIPAYGDHFHCRKPTLGFDYFLVPTELLCFEIRLFYNFRVLGSARIKNYRRRAHAGITQSHHAMTAFMPGNLVHAGLISWLDIEEDFLVFLCQTLDI